VKAVGAGQAGTTFNPLSMSDNAYHCATSLEVMRPPPDSRNRSEKARQIAAIVFSAELKKLWLAALLGRHGGRFLSSQTHRFQ
jgi:hypothetical protein